MYMCHATALRSVAHYRCDVLGGMGLGTSLVRARANFLVLQKFSPPLRSANFFFWLYNQLFVPPNSIRGMSGFYVKIYWAEKLNQIWVPLNTVDYFKWMNYWISDSACFLLTRRQLIPKRKGEELSFCEMVGEWKSLGCALFWHCFRRETEFP